MSDFILARPAASAQETVGCTPEAKYVFTFPVSDAVFARNGDDLDISFEDGGVLHLQGFYTAHAGEEEPQFEVDGEAVSAGDFFTAMNMEDLAPAAGPGPSTVGGPRFHEFASAELAGGIDHLGALDWGMAVEVPASDTLASAGVPALDDDEGEAAPAFVAQAPGIAPSPAAPVPPAPETVTDTPSAPEPAPRFPGIDPARVSLSEEADLAGSQTYIVSGAVEVAAPEGVKAIHINGVEISLDPASPTAIDLTDGAGVSYGSLEAAYNAETGTVEYTFSCSGPAHHDKATEDESLDRQFSMTVTDGQDHSASSLFTVSVEDSVPGILLEKPYTSISANNSWIKAGTYQSVDGVEKFMVNGVEAEKVTGSPSGFQAHIEGFGIVLFQGGADDKYDGHFGTIWFLPSETSTGTLNGLNIELVDEDGDVCATKGYVGNNYQLLTGGAVSFNENILANGQAYETHGVMQVAASAGVESLLINGASVSLDGSETSIALNGYGTLTVAYDAGRGVLDYTYACDAPVTHQQSAEDTSLTRSFMVEMTTDDGSVEHSLFNVTIGDSVPVMNMDWTALEAIMTGNPSQEWLPCGTCEAVDGIGKLWIYTYDGSYKPLENSLDVRNGEYEILLENIGTLKFVPGADNTTGTIYIQPEAVQPLGTFFMYFGVQDYDNDWTNDLVWSQSTQVSAAWSSWIALDNSAGIAALNGKLFPSLKPFWSGEGDAPDAFDRHSEGYYSPSVNGDSFHKTDFAERRDITFNGQKIGEMFFGYQKEYDANTPANWTVFARFDETLLGAWEGIILNVPCLYVNPETGEEVYYLKPIRLAAADGSEGANATVLEPNIILPPIPAEDLGAYAQSLYQFTENSLWDRYSQYHCVVQVEGFPEIDSLNWYQYFYKDFASLDATAVTAPDEVDVDDTVIPDVEDDRDEDSGSGEAALSGAGAEDAGAAAQAEGVQEAEGAQEGAFLAATFAAGRDVEGGETLEDDGETGREDVLEQMIGEEVSLASLENGGPAGSLQNSLFGEAEDGARESAGDAGRAAETSEGDAPGAGVLEAILEEDADVEALFTAPADSADEEAESVLFIDYNPTDYLIDGSDENLDILLANGLPEHTLADMLDNGARGDDQNGPMARDVDALFSGDGIQSIQSIQDLTAYGVNVDPEAKTISLDATWAKDEAATEAGGATTVYARDGMSLETTMIETPSSGDEITLAMHAIQSDTGNA